VLVALGGPLLGAVVDQRGRRKPWMAVFSAAGITATALLWFVRPDPACVPLAIILVMAGTIACEYAAILYNAMLAFLAPPETRGRWSGWGWGMGYVGGIVCLSIALLLFVRNNAAWMGLSTEQAENVRAVFPFAAGWFLLFSLPLFIFTPDKPFSGKPFRKSIRSAVGQLADSLRNIRHYRDHLKFLIARMIYIDGLATVFAYGGVYAAGVYDMTEQEVLVFGIVLNITAGAGALLFAWIDDRIGSKRTILIGILGILIPGTVAVMSPSRALFWIAALVLGIFVGPVQAASRSYLSRAAPEDMHNQMFGLYAFSGKATAFLGPLLVSLGIKLSGSMRIGISLIGLFFVTGFIMLWFVPPADKAGTAPG
jgi:UMF1 family MFS transporter